MAVTVAGALASNPQLWADGGPAFTPSIQRQVNLPVHCRRPLLQAQPRRSRGAINAKAGAPSMQVALHQQQVGGWPAGGSLTETQQRPAVCNLSSYSRVIWLPMVLEPRPAHFWQPLLVTCSLRLHTSGGFLSHAAFCPRNQCAIPATACNCVHSAH